VALAKKKTKKKKTERVGWIGKLSNGFFLSHNSNNYKMGSGLFYSHHPCKDEIVEFSVKVLCDLIGF
jgi:hypothetical protein